MIHLTQGNLLKADAEAIVNTVNCVGFMGKGIALQFKQAYPENFKAYEKACKNNEVQPGKMFIFDRQSMIQPKYIINFPTKRHWKGKSKLEDIQAGLDSLIADIKRLKIRSIAIPPLGCGLGGLDWNIVHPLIENAFTSLPDVQVFLFPPTGTPDAKTMLIKTDKPHLTPARALFIKLMSIYKELDYQLTLLEIQKLAYFLQEAGEDLNLKFEVGKYGPYADNLNKVLERLEGHYIRGYGDSQKPGQDIELLPGAVQEATAFLKDKSESTQRLNIVASLIEGFETPYGMEMLASAHWVVKHQNAKTEEDAIHLIHSWNERKKKIFKEEHIRITWQRLVEQQWI